MGRPAVLLGSASAHDAKARSLQRSGSPRAECTSSSARRLQTRPAAMERASAAVSPVRNTWTAGSRRNERRSNPAAARVSARRAWRIRAPRATLWRAPSTEGPHSGSSWHTTYTGRTYSRGLGGS
uniref:Uncharacterized protein n=1 Tax=Ixodes ricinus TaxID=34613 RepID=A0A6B0UP63_IXORI